MGIVKSQLSPFNWKTVLVLGIAVVALFFAFRTFAKFNTDPAATVEQEQQPLMAPQVPNQLSQSEQAYAEQEAHSEQESQVEQPATEIAAANE